MNRLPDNQKKFRERANRYKRALIKEQRASPHLGDGAGKRYLVGPLYMLAGDTVRLNTIVGMNKPSQRIAANLGIVSIGRWRAIVLVISSRRTPSSLPQ